MQLVYDTSGCSSRGVSWSPSNRYLNRSQPASTRLCDNHIIMSCLCSSQGFSWSPSNRYLSRSKLASPRLISQPYIIMHVSLLECDTSGCSSQDFSWSPSNRHVNRSKLASTRLCYNHNITTANRGYHNMSRTYSGQDRHLISLTSCGALY